MDDLKYIVVDGLIRSGKTKLAEILADELGGRLVKDNKENPFLNDFYASLTNDRDLYSLKTQLIFLLNRYSQQLEVSQKGLFHKTTISDYIFYRDGIYAHILLNDQELGIYKKMFDLFSASVTPCDLVIYLQISFSEMVRRIQESGTPAERQVPGAYWREVYEAYNYYFFNYHTSPLLVVNMEKVDLDNRDDIQHLLDEINLRHKGTRYYAPG